MQIAFIIKNKCLIHDLKTRKEVNTSAIRYTKLNIHLKR